MESSVVVVSETESVHWIHWWMIFHHSRRKEGRRGMWWRYHMWMLVKAGWVTSHHAEWMRMKRRMRRKRKRRRRELCWEHLMIPSMEQTSHHKRRWRHHVRRMMEVSME